MFLPFFGALREAGVPVSLREHLTWLAALRAGLALYDIDAFYHLARAALVKDERHIDRFDRVFAASFGGLEAIPAAAVLEALDLPPGWLERQAELYLTPEERAALATSGGFEALMETLRQRLAEQEGRHEGGSKWVGTAGTSPFGAYGDNPEGVRIGQEGSRRLSAAKVWDQRAFRDLDGDAPIGTRAMQVALRRLRLWARDGAAEELDMAGTIRATARQGWLDVQTRPERRNAVKVLLFLDVGGSMDAHVTRVSELFSAARSAFSHLEQVYFHNCLYEGVWRDNARRWQEQIPTRNLLRRYGADWRAIFVGDASMSPYEIALPGGASEHWNDESGETWLRRAFEHWPEHLWINPVRAEAWEYTQSIGMIRALLGEGRMVPLTLDGLTAGMSRLAR
ncbi:VWA domain-containing protein [Pseudoroseicyclus sp. CXY001]|uniref:vWA domain-containing protein n=1 Tax=Pseudoroseicyclus sp. CXY001 TaxID=3242492 RepID=UPI003570AAAD